MIPDPIDLFETDRQMGLRAKSPNSNASNGAGLKLQRNFLTCESSYRSQLSLMGPDSITMKRLTCDR